LVDNAADALMQRLHGTEMWKRSVIRAAHYKVLRQRGVQHEGSERHGRLLRQLRHRCSRAATGRHGHPRREVLRLLRVLRMRRYAALPAGTLCHLLSRK
jgi:hypothetical protein